MIHVPQGDFPPDATQHDTTKRSERKNEVNKEPTRAPYTTCTRSRTLTSAVSLGVAQNHFVVSDSTLAIELERSDASVVRFLVGHVDESSVVAARVEARPRVGLVVHRSRGVSTVGVGDVLAGRSEACGVQSSGQVQIVFAIVVDLSREIDLSAVVFVVVGPRPGLVVRDRPHDATVRRFETRDSVRGEGETRDAHADGSGPPHDDRRVRREHEVAVALQP